MSAYKCTFGLILIAYLLPYVVSGCRTALQKPLKSDDCILSLKEDFGNPTPVFLRHGTYMRPDRNGAISFKRSETVLVACPGEKRQIMLDNQRQSYATLEAHCIINSTFRVDRWIGQFKNITCNSQPWFTAEDTQTKCHENSRLYKVGYKVNNVLHSLYEACFNPALLQTDYVKHQLSPISSYMQPGLARPQFTEGSLFDKVRMSQLYKLDHQKNRFDSILGDGMSSSYLVTNKQYLTRGHLAARADFTLGAELRASFHYVNTAPQWMRGNGGDWSALEDALRRRVHTLGVNVTVYTGTHGLMTLPDARGEQQPIYLTTDANNNGLVPVPMYFYKLVHDPEAKTATAFLSINSSFYNRTMIQELSFCEDICEQNRKFSWLKWRQNDGTHSFCCEYTDFIDTVNSLPKINVEGIFH